MNEKHWAVRKIRKGGRVKIGGVWYKPTAVHQKYDGRLDGLVYLFGRYRGYGEPDDINGYRPFLFCWGLAENSGRDPNEWVPDPREVDGTFPWPFWYAEGQERSGV